MGGRLPSFPKLQAAVTVSGGGIGDRRAVRSWRLHHIVEARRWPDSKGIVGDVLAVTSGVDWQWCGSGGGVGDWEGRVRRSSEKLSNLSGRSVVGLFINGHHLLYVACV